MKLKTIKLFEWSSVWKKCIWIILNKWQFFLLDIFSFACLKLFNFVFSYRPLDFEFSIKFSCQVEPSNTNNVWIGCVFWIDLVFMKLCQWYWSGLAQNSNNNIVLFKTKYNKNALVFSLYSLNKTSIELLLIPENKVNTVLSA